MPNMRLGQLLPSGFTLVLVLVLALAFFLPARGWAAGFFDQLSSLAIALLFFLHGARLPGSQILSAFGYFRLHGAILFLTYGIFPLLGLALRPVILPYLGQDLYAGMLFLCALPSTIQTSIAMTGMARGNVPAALSSATLSNVLGVFLTPVIVGSLIAFAVMGSGGDTGFQSIWTIMKHLLFPFILGQVLHKRLIAFIRRAAPVLRYTDQSVILLVIYTVFGAGVQAGVWDLIAVNALVALVVICLLLLVLVLMIALLFSRVGGFPRHDEIPLIFCGAQKSLASGVSMAKILLVGSSLGIMILPLMVFHQIQLLVCASIASHYARKAT